MFQSNENSSRSLNRVAELLFRQSQLFGQLSVDQGISRGQVKSALVRAGPVKSLLTSLETMANLRFGSVRLPFCYNRETWSNQQPAGGYTTASSAPLPSEVLSSLLLAWNLHNPGSRTINYSASDPEVTSIGEKSNLVERLIRSTLAVVARGDFTAGLEYLFDLLQAGFIINTRTLSNALIILLVARSQAESDTDMISRFYGGSVPESSEDSINLDVHYEWLEIESLGINWIDFGSLAHAVNFRVNRSRIEPYIVGLLEATLARVDFVRGAETFDDWVVGQTTLGGQISVITAIVNGLIRSVPLAMQAILSQLEEIRADVGSLTKTLAMQYGIPSYYSGFEFIKHIAEQYKRVLGEDWADRFFTERLLVPQALRSALLPDLVIQNKAAEWDALSWTLAQPFCYALRDQVPVAVISKKSDTSIELMRLAEPVVPSFLSRTAGLDLTKILTADAAQEPSERFGADSGLVQAIGAMVLRSENDYSSPSWMSVIDALDPKHVEAQNGSIFRQRSNLDVILEEYKDECIQEIMAGLELAWQQDGDGPPAEAIRVLSSLLEMYPWNAAAFQELSIATDQNGDPRAALEFMIRSLVLDPRKSVPWQSLSVILRRLDAQRESRLAQAIGMATKQIEHLYVLA